MSTARQALWRRGGLGILAAVVVNLAILVVGSVADVSFLVPDWTGEGEIQVGAAQVVASTVVPIVLGLLAFTWAAGREAAVRWLFIASVVLAVLSLAMPLTTDTDWGTRVLLLLMHPVAAGGLLWPAAALRAGERRAVVGATAS